MNQVQVQEQGQETTVDSAVIQGIQGTATPTIDLSMFAFYLDPSGKLGVRPNNLLTDETRAYIREHKEEIIEKVKRAKPATDQPWEFRFRPPARATQAETKEQAALEPAQPARLNINRFTTPCAAVNSAIRLAQHRKAMLADLRDTLHAYSQRLSIAKLQAEGMDEHLIFDAWIQRLFTGGTFTPGSFDRFQRKDIQNASTKAKGSVAPPEWEQYDYLGLRDIPGKIDALDREIELGMSMLPTQEEIESGKAECEGIITEHNGTVQAYQSAYDTVISLLEQLEAPLRTIAGCRAIMAGSASNLKSTSNAFGIDLKTLSCAMADNSVPSAKQDYAFNLFNILRNRMQAENESETALALKAARAQYQAKSKR